MHASLASSKETLEYFLLRAEKRERERERAHRIFRAHNLTRAPNELPVAANCAISLNLGGTEKRRVRRTPD